MTEEISAIDQPRWDPIYKLLEHTTSIGREGFEPGEEAKDFLHKIRILVIGAGGLGCEILKDLALSGFKTVDVIDMDTIDVSNLNRQFLFGEADVGKPKSVVAAAFMNDRVEGCHITAHHCKIQDMPLDFYKSFDIVIAGLDSIDARRWLNGTLVNIARERIAAGENVIPMIDGGSEGFAGQARVIAPMLDSCFECQLSSLPPQTTYPMCTIASNPRLPEHCVEFAILEFPKTHAGRKASGDNPADVQWLLEVASKRSQQYHIEGVTYKLTLGVVKNIIPAVASTNAIVAAACVNEALKLATNLGHQMDNYMAYSGAVGAYTNTFHYERNPECNVCREVAAPTKYRVSPEWTLQMFIDKLAQDPNFQLKRPSLTTPDNSVTLYMRIIEATHANLPRPLGELTRPGMVISVSDPCLTSPLLLELEFTK
ncbi:putative NEDD8-activating enzyme E1 catalytic subunit [Paratrimastix pyriformis]|uniref:NEDD8-activating enzyme E1 catalytic subunit n=1 Tax=Paratrimastix pyriformis TaxID=342808 RepID=A0ABQ8U9H5_9EUKA|nr:putative NEDD8-activating enzyme E1 catalytic subunit [Paratrimastix pyriformis]